MGPCASMNAKREENRGRGGERANRWDQAGMALSGSRLRMRAEGPETLLQVLCGMLGVLCGCFLLAKKTQDSGRGDFRSTREKLLPNDCLLAADKAKTNGNKQ